MKTFLEVKNDVICDITLCDSYNNQRSGET
jgi:hypothetical protein